MLTEPQAMGVPQGSGYGFTSGLRLRGFRLKVSVRARASLSNELAAACSVHLIVIEG